MNWVISLIEGIRSARAQVHVPAGLQLPMVQVALDDKGRRAWANNVALIERLARTEGLTEGPTPKGAITIAVEGGTFAIALAGIIDVAEEQARLSKAVEKLGKEMGGLKGRLTNPKFIESAPDDVVEETRELLAVKEDELARLNGALARLAEIG